MFATPLSALGRVALAAAIPLAPPAGRALDPADWSLYRSRFVAAEGRVVDTGRGGTSHSEGQGIGLLLSAAYGDRDAFERVWSWSRRNLQIRGDKLFAWKWAPREGGGAVEDDNDAADGDILIAWALARAAAKWDVPTYREEATWITRDLRAKLLRRSSYGLVILPGSVGFEKPEGLTVNLSYWVFPAFRDFGKLEPAAEWPELIRNGLDLLKAARFGRWQLPPDWLLLGEKPGLPEGFAPRFGYDAIRIPLYLTWAGLGDRPTLEPFLRFWTYFRGARFTPAWTDLQSDAIDSYDAPPGMQAVRELVRDATSAPPSRSSGGPRPDVRDNYYSSSLLLLTKLARIEGRIQ